MSAVVPAPLAELLNEEQKRHLGVRDLAAEAVLDRLAGVASEDLSALSLDDSVASTLYEAALDFASRGASDAQCRVLRALPIHPTIAGDRAGCTGSAYVNAGGVKLGDLPAALREQVTLLRPHHDEARRIGQKKLVRDLNATAMLGLLVKHEEGSEVVTAAPKLFLELLAKADKLSDDLEERLARLAWVSTPLGPRAPRDVLRLPFSALWWTGRREVSEADLLGRRFLSGRRCCTR